MINLLARLFSLLTILVGVAFVVGSARPGTHRILCPECFDMTEIAPGIFSDVPAEATRHLGLVRSARTTVSEFFGGSLRQPNIVLCATRSCAETFGIRGNGLSIAHVAVMVSPGGLTEGTLTHEMTHFRLHRSLGPRNIVRQPYPTWFDEGLATHVADHPRWSGEITPEARRRIVQVKRFWQWDDAYREIGVGRAYRAAAREVALIEAAAGRDGLLELIDRTEAGENFRTVLNDVTGR